MKRTYQNLRENAPIIGTLLASAYLAASVTPAHGTSHMSQTELRMPHETFNCMPAVLREENEQETLKLHYQPRPL